MEFGSGFKVFHFRHKGSDYFLLQGKHKSRFVEAYGNRRKAFMKRYCKKHFGQHEPIELPDDSLVVLMQPEKRDLPIFASRSFSSRRKDRDKDWEALEEARQDRVCFDMIRYLEEFAGITQDDINHYHASTVNKVVDSMTRT